MSLFVFVQKMDSKIRMTMETSWEIQLKVRSSLPAIKCWLKSTVVGSLPCSESHAQKPHNVAFPTSRDDAS